MRGARVSWGLQPGNAQMALPFGVTNAIFFGLLEHYISLQFWAIVFFGFYNFK